MCGIAGGYNLSRDQVEGMVSSMHHRGPDGRGYFQQTDFSMGMARLAIQDSDRGEQPFTSSCGRYRVIFNGEIYNWRALRAELQSSGHRFSTECDGEILPSAWKEWKGAMFSKLNGMFSIAIFDCEKRELILARDHCGQKPLYYTTTSRGIVFASEIKALRAGGVSLSPNQDALAAYLMNRYVSEPETMFNEVRVFPVAHWATVSPSGEFQLQRYWQAPTTEPISYESSLSDTLKRLGGITQSSVKLTQQSDWKSVLYLSSGVDSNLLAKYLSQSGGTTASLSLGFESCQDETTAATESAKAFGLEHENVFLRSEDLDELPRVIGQMERPVGDALILAFDALAKGAKSMGAKVAYGAEGIDEHFGGYSFHKAYFRAQKLGTLGRRAASEFLNLAPDALIDRLAKFPASLGEEGKQRVQRYLKKFSSFSSDNQADYLRFLYEPSELGQVSQGLSTPESKKSAEPWSMNALLARQYDSWLQDWSLIRQDKNNMAHSIEYRSPFLDPSMIEFAFSLPSEWKINGGQDKWIWRKLAEQQLPKHLAWRPKVPFYLPLEQEAWRKKLVAMSHDVLTETALSSHGWLDSQEIQKLQKATDFLPLKKLAALVIFQLWYDQYF